MTAPEDDATPVFETLYDYAPFARHGRVVFLAGQVPKTGLATLLAAGRCGEAVDLPSACAAARLAARQGLAWIDRAAAPGERLDRILRLDVFVACGPDFMAVSEVADAASGEFRRVLGADFACPRSVIGVARLPRDAPVLLEITAALRGGAEPR